MRILLFTTLIVSIFACSTPDQSHLGAFEVYCEMVASNAKPIALHYPMERQEIEINWARFTEVADKYDVELFREDAFPNSLLFPSGQTEGKSVILIYRGARLEQYNQWKADVSAAGNDPGAEEALARRLGRLLGYTPQGINELLNRNSDYDNLALHGVKRQITHLFYSDVEEAVSFYRDILKLNVSDSNTVQISEDGFLRLNPVSAIHPADQPKSTAIALLTDQLPEWYSRLQEQGVPIKYTYKPKDGGPHDGFVAIDPGGYLLEFEQFKQHPENELFMAFLAPAKRMPTGFGSLEFYGTITWTYHRDLLKMQQFYEEVLGFRMVADQGWTKIYQTSPTGFIGLVDERRGMEDYADEKAIEIEWKISEAGSFDSYAGKKWSEYDYSEKSVIGPERYVYRITN